MTLANIEKTIMIASALAAILSATIMCQQALSADKAPAQMVIQPCIQK